MKILCAWCCRDGQPGYLGEREPLENPLPTHGICERHKAEVLTSRPSRSFPDAELVIVVRRDSRALYERLKWLFASMCRVAVILDRRVSDRRTPSRERSNGRRYVRTRRIREGTPSPLGDFIILRFTPKTPATPADGALDDAAEPVDPEQVTLMAETAVMMTRPPTSGWFARPPSPRTGTAR
ncbi:MAG: hypothetical protein ACRELZ_16270 [Candidatus Rokuibacteriota bacterium]